MPISFQTSLTLTMRKVYFKPIAVADGQRYQALRDSVVAFARFKTTRIVFTNSRAACSLNSTATRGYESGVERNCHDLEGLGAPGCKREWTRDFVEKTSKAPAKSRTSTSSR